MTALSMSSLSVAVLLPCYNEEKTIGDVVARFRAALPGARILVFDNNSKDLTALRARAAGATVIREPRQGKGNVVRRMFADIDADIYVMADGDGTYAPEDAPLLINTLLTEHADMAVGTRRGVTDDAGRAGHAVGNRLFNALYHRLFGRDFTDIFSGYRAFTRRYVKSFPALSNGFEIETEMSVHASVLKIPVVEIALDYGRRVEGSASKLSTYKDGAKILWMFAMLMKETQPFRFFGLISLAVCAASLVLMTPVLVEFAETGLVPRMPTWMLSIGLLVMSMLLAATGMILDSVARGRTEQKRMVYLAFGPARSEPMQRPQSADKPERKARTA
jgi:glycosyltransferase involved in cell wall biosynthesis